MAASPARARVAVKARLLLHVRPAAGVARPGIEVAFRAAGR